MADNTVPNRWNWKVELIGNTSDITLEELIDLYISDILITTQSMFKYTGLPDTLPQKDLELIIQCNGSATIAKANNGKLYAFRGGLGGVPDAYYLPTVSVVSNPYLNLSKTFKIGVDCVVIKNDALYFGLLPHIKRVAYLLAQADISFKFGLINSRVPAIPVAGDDGTKASFDVFFRHIVTGDKFDIPIDEVILNKLSVFDYGKQHNQLTNLIELRQYIMGTFFQSIGIEAPFNMKREAINEAEASLNQDVLIPKIDDMLKVRKEAIEKVNELFGTSITVELNSVWAQMRKQREKALSAQESEVNESNENDNERS